MTRQLIWLDSFDFSFPDTANALKEPNGLLAVGGDLTTIRLLSAYQKGIFPWFSDGQPVLWWTPNPRMVLNPSELYINRSLRKLARKRLFEITVDHAFASVINHCSLPRTVEGEEETGTWITEDIKGAYCELHRQGFAHSIEAWQDGELVGGLYGVALGKVFYGESMFSRASGASKIAFTTLVQQLAAWGYELIDCQMHSQYLASFGSEDITREEFEQRLKDLIPGDLIENWRKGAHQPHNWRKEWAQAEHGFG